MTALLVIVILVLLIVVHELGHFLVAKLFRIKVEEFGVGYPPRAFLFGKWGDTEYTLNWLPFGGFVRLFGEEGLGHGRGSIADAPRGVQATILVAGVAANAILAWFLFATSLHLGVPTVVEEPLPGEQVHLYISDVVPGSPADSGGLKPGDELLAMVDEKGATLASLTPESAMEYVRERGGEAIAVEYARAQKVSTTTVRPANAVVPGAEGRPALGVGLVLVANRSLPWSEAFTQSFSITGRSFTSTLQSLEEIARTALMGRADLSGVVGPVGLLSVVGDASHNGLGNVLRLAAFISMNLAVINLIPIPALDGGRLLVVCIEAVMRRSAPRLMVKVLNVLGIAFIILLMFMVTYNDIGRLLA